MVPCHYLWLKDMCELLIYKNQISSFRVKELFNENGSLLKSFHSKKLVHTCGKYYWFFFKTTGWHKLSCQSNCSHVMFCNNFFKESWRYAVAPINLKNLILLIHSNLPSIYSLKILSSWYKHQFYFIEYRKNHETVMRTVITCKKIPL